MSRPEGRRPDELRSVRMQPGWSKYAEGSCLIEMGDTRVLCTATVDETVPHFMKGTSMGWVTGEYGMLPRSCNSRILRDASRSRPDGRALEIQRLIGRSLRAVVDTRALGERTLLMDCDVLQADGGTRTAAITGAYIALSQAIAWLREQEKIKTNPILSNLAAVSVGVVENEECLDLCYTEDSSASVDMNVVMTTGGKLIEVQSTAEGAPFDRTQLLRLLDLAQAGIDQLIDLQNAVIATLQ